MKQEKILFWGFKRQKKAFELKNRMRGPKQYGREIYPSIGNFK
jgi:hypothetical protein